MSRFFRRLTFPPLLGLACFWFGLATPGPVWGQSQEHTLSEDEIEELQAREEAKLAEVRGEISKINEEARYEQERLLAQLGDPPRKPTSKGIGAGSGVPTAAFGGGAMGAGIGAAAGSLGGNAGYGAAAGALAGIIGGIIAQSIENDRIEKQMEKQYKQELARYDREKKAIQGRVETYRKSLLANYRAKLAQEAASQRRRLQEES
ncbi:hypothetical protein EBX31_06930 [bacterium]|nr:hypothetical protein [bacterium]